MRITENHSKSMIWRLPFFKTCSHVATIFLWCCLLSRHHAERLWIDSCESFSVWSLRSKCSASKSLIAIAGALSISYQVADSDSASHCQHRPPWGTRATAFRYHRIDADLDSSNLTKSRLSRRSGKQRQGGLEKLAAERDHFIDSTASLRRFFDALATRRRNRLSRFEDSVWFTPLRTGQRRRPPTPTPLSLRRRRRRRRWWRWRQWRRDYAASDTVAHATVTDTMTIYRDRDYRARGMSTLARDRSQSSVVPRRTSPTCYQRERCRKQRSAIFSVGQNTTAQWPARRRPTA